METETVPRCPICGKEGLPWKSHTFINDLTVCDIKLDRCTHCDTIYQNPRMTRPEMDRYYREGKYRKTYGVVISKERGDWQTMFLSTLKITPKRCLDVGCSRGYLLWSLKKKFGTEILGLDLLVDHTLIDEIVGSKRDVKGLFDLVVSSHQLEHTYDPNEELKWMISKLAPNGVLFLELPLRHKIVLPHTYIFTRKSIDVMLKAAGMKYLYIDMEESCEILAQREQEAGKFLQDGVTVLKVIEKPVYCG